ncbi:MAG: YcaO-like family protein [Xenococcaceae cyanobacterium]
MKRLDKGYTWGTHRWLAPAQTLANIQPHLSAMGITRCADVTGLDRLGIPVYCAIRPPGILLQVSNGKGLTHEAAQVSALMEAIEVFHMETPGEDLQRNTLNSLRCSGHSALDPHVLPQYRSETFFSPDYVIDWFAAENLLTHESVWLPASAVYDCSSRHSPALYELDSNGLASGNHRLEATLHALYEVIERDAISRLSIMGRLYLQARCKFIDLQTIDDSPIQALCDQISAADCKLVLIWVQGCIPINTFWAVLLDQNPFSPSIIVTPGYGTHLSLSVAATRAITEAAQGRCTWIHGARDDIPDQRIYETNETHHKIYAYFDRLESTTPWQVLRDFAGDDLRQDYDIVLHALQEAGYDNVFQADLTRAPFHIPVVKVFVPGLTINQHFF